MPPPPAARTCARPSSSMTSPMWFRRGRRSRRGSSRRIFAPLEKQCLGFRSRPRYNVLNTAGCGPGRSGGQSSRKACWASRSAISRAACRCRSRSARAASSTLAFSLAARAFSMAYSAFFSSSVTPWSWRRRGATSTAGQSACARIEQLARYAPADSLRGEGDLGRARSRAGQPGAPRRCRRVQGPGQILTHRPTPEDHPLRMIPDWHRGPIGQFGRLVVDLRINGVRLMVLRPRGRPPRRRRRVALPRRRAGPRRRRGLARRGGLPVRVEVGRGLARPDPAPLARALEDHRPYPSSSNVTMRPAGSQVRRIRACRKV